MTAREIRKHALGAMAVCCTLAASGPARAELVFVSVNDDIQGRGITMRAIGRCFVLVPNHVVSVAEQIQVIGRGQARGIGRVVKSFDEGGGNAGGAAIDLALLEVDSPKITCDEAMPDARSVDQALNDVDSVIVKRVNGTGQLQNSPALVRQAGSTSLVLAPGPNPEDALHQGDSGSTIYSGKIPVAMLVSKGERQGGSYTALRLDMLTALANGYFAGLAPPKKMFQFGSVKVDNQIPGAAQAPASEAPAVLVSMEGGVRTEAERLLSASKQFPPVLGQGAAEQGSIVGTVSISILGFETIRNGCRAVKKKVFGMMVDTFEADGNSECSNGFEQLDRIARLTIRMSGDVRVGSSGVQVPILNQFTLVLPAEAGSLTAPLRDEISFRLCEVTRLAVNKAMGIKGGGGLLGLGPISDVVPQLNNVRARNHC